MITKYLNFILEKSSLNKIKLPQNLLSILHSMFHINSKVNVEYKTFDNATDLILYKNIYIHQNNNKYQIIVDFSKKNIIYYFLDDMKSKQTNLIIKNNLENTNGRYGNHAIIIEYFENKLEIFIVDFEYLQTFILNTQIMEININDKNIPYNKFKFNKNDDIYQIIETKWLSILTKLYSQYYNDLKIIFKISLNDIQKYNEDDLNYKYFNEIKNDLTTLEIYKDKKELMSVIKSYTRKIIDDTYRDDITNVGYDMKKLDFNQIAKKAVFYFYKQTNEYFNFKKYRKYRRVIELDPSLWKQIEHNVFDKKLRDEFQHLTNANKFDLI